MRRRTRFCILNDPIKTSLWHACLDAADDLYDLVQPKLGNEFDNLDQVARAMLQRFGMPVHEFHQVMNRHEYSRCGPDDIAYKIFTGIWEKDAESAKPYKLFLNQEVRNFLIQLHGRQRVTHGLGEDDKTQEGAKFIIDLITAVNRFVAYLANDPPDKAEVLGRLERRFGQEVVKWFEHRIQLLMTGHNALNPAGDIIRDIQGNKPSPFAGLTAPDIQWLKAEAAFLDQAVE